jgi:hypothetical protein
MEIEFGVIQTVQCKRNKLFHFFSDFELWRSILSPWIRSLFCRDDRCCHGAFDVVAVACIPRGFMSDVHVMNNPSHGKTGNSGGAERRSAYRVSWRRWISQPSVRISGLIVQESGYCMLDIIDSITVRFHTASNLSPVWLIAWICLACENFCKSIGLQDKTLNAIFARYRNSAFAWITKNIS